MSFQSEFEKAYEAKKNENMDFVLSFLDKWEEIADLEHIPYIMKLFGKEIIDDTQNIAVTNMLNSIIKKNPEKGIETLFQNINILSKENGEDGMPHIVSLLLDDYGEYAGFFAESLLHVEIELRKEIINYITFSCKTWYGLVAAGKVVSIYNTLANNKEEHICFPYGTWEWYVATGELVSSFNTIANNKEMNELWGK